MSATTCGAMLGSIKSRESCPRRASPYLALNAHLAVFTGSHPEPSLQRACIDALKIHKMSEPTSGNVSEFLTTQKGVVGTAYMKEDGSMALPKAGSPDVSRNLAEDIDLEYPEEKEDDDDDIAHSSTADLVVSNRRSAMRITTALMDTCAARRRGLVFALSKVTSRKETASLDHVVIDYQWDDLEASVYFNTGRAPMMLEEVMPFQPCIALVTMLMDHGKYPSKDQCLITPLAYTNRRHPHLTLWWPDMGTMCMPGADNDVFVIPSERLRFPAAKFRSYSSFKARVPLESLIKEVPTNYLKDMEKTVNFMLEFLDTNSLTCNFGSTDDMQVDKVRYRRTFQHFLREIHDEDMRWSGDSKLDGTHEEGPSGESLDE
ncbi:hypothetical protein OPT61_g4223 [Boeremia exigua]|uniref:Uncharacterized protein n=1 Tax=Boeremia exigua TaxID=749465 RepID=A0ACC2IES8_9PLEO|nr:hypothetical protein OPT61_g4223 [Boeremia exigua]